MAAPHIRLGTRASKLAMTQSRWVEQQLIQLGASVELITIKTEGDVRTQPLAQIGGQGLFTKQLQLELLAGNIDLAVHSLKDLPTQTPEELCIAAIPVRENPADVLLVRQGLDPHQLPGDSILGTGSVRRAAQLKYWRSDLQIRDLRGNVDTRLQKLEDGEYDGIVLAAAGLSRLGLASRIDLEFPTDQLYPAVGQGALGLEVRGDDEATRNVVAQLNCPDSFSCAMAERRMLQRLFAGCLAPVGARTHVNEGQLELTGVVLSPDGTERLLACETAQTSEFESLGNRVAEALLDQGANRWLSDPEN